MKTRTTRIALGALLLSVSTANAKAADEKTTYRLGIIAITVTPEDVKEKKVPFQFDLSATDGTSLKLSIFIGPATPEFGTPRDCSVVLSGLPLPDDKKKDSQWAIDAAQPKNAKRTIAIEVPSESKKSTFRLLVLSRVEAERALLSFRYAKPDYGGEVYFVPLGRFLTEEKPPIRD